MSFNDLIDALTTNPPIYDTAIIASLCGVFVFLVIGILSLGVNKLKITLASLILCLASMGTIAYVSVAVSHQQDKHASDYTLSRNKTYFYVESHTEYIKSAKFKILGEDKKYIYVQKDGKTYNIPQIQERKKR